MSLALRRIAAALVFALAAVALPALRTLPACAQPAAVAPAGDALARIRQTGVLRVGLTGDYDPFSVVDGTGAFHGVDVDAATMLASAIAPNVKVQIVKTSWPTMSEDLLAGKFDLAMGGVSRNKSRAESGELSHTYLVDGKVALIRVADKARFHTLADLDREGVTVLVNPGGTNQQFVAATIANAKVVVVPDNRAIPTMVADGRGDVMFTDGVEAKLAAKRDPRLLVLAADQPWTRVEKVYYLPKGQTAFLDLVNAWVDKMQTSGEYAKLWAKYL
ncbi:MAG: transporter substrate-binding domain-containing protein [Candidatus Eremiobacteraeota bacterium]|nr:transporter substrate-binding domain-containing protein [Candidatus Eremiobacteraeota bacterium]